MEAEAMAHPGNALRHARLGLLYAYMGRKAGRHSRRREEPSNRTPVTQGRDRRPSMARAISR